MHKRHAFTLIELLVVILIIGIIASILIASVGLLGESAKERKTRQRMENVIAGLRAHHPGEGLVDVVQQALLGKEQRWDSIRNVVNTATRLPTNPLVLDDVNMIIPDSNLLTGPPYLPPNITSIYDHKIGNVYPKGITWVPLRYHPELGVSTSATIDRILVFEHFSTLQSSQAHEQYSKGGMDPRLVDKSWPRWISNVHGVAGQSRRNDFWVSIDHGLIIDTAYSIVRFAGANAEPLRHCRAYYTNSPLGETIDTTLEVVPDSRWDRASWYEAWPYLIEYRDRDDTLVQHAWSDSDWNQEAPGAVPPIWEMPFGQHVVQQRDNTLIEQYLRRSDDDEGRHLGEFSPLATIAILQAAGILAAGDAGADDYRTDRSPERDWNDAWGNPLVVGAALFIAPRHDANPEFLTNSNDPSSYTRGDLSFHEYAEYWGQVDANGRIYPGQSQDTLQGGRDWLMRRLQESYGAGRIAYLAVGSMGERRTVTGDDNAVEDVITDWSGAGKLTWNASDDAVVLRAAWLHTTERCQAHRYRDSSYANPPWDGVARERAGGYTTMLSAPQEIR